MMNCQILIIARGFQHFEQFIVKKSRTNTRVTIWMELNFWEIRGSVISGQHLVSYMINCG